MGDTARPLTFHSWKIENDCLIPSRNRPKRVRIARIVLHSERGKLGPKYGNSLGEGFQRFIAKTYCDDLPAYHARLSELMSSAKSLDPDITLFPACAAVVKSRSELVPMRKTAGELKVVAIGVLEVGDRKKLIEYSEVWERGRLIGRFDADFTLAVRAGGMDLLAAQSSTIKQVYRKPWKIRPATSAKLAGMPTIALDLGHAQYNGWYKRVLLRLREEGLGVALSFWRSRGGNTKYAWAEEAEFFRRTQNGQTQDFVDVFDIKK